MTIEFELDEFTGSLFPNLRGVATGAAGGSPEVLAERLADYYTAGPIRPSIRVQGTRVRIELDAEPSGAERAEFARIVDLFAQHDFRRALPAMRALVAKNPTISDYHRLLGQLLAVTGDQDGAIDALLAALRWDPRSGSALITIGDLYADHKRDMATATRFYDQALALDLADHRLISHLGLTLHRMGRLDEAEHYLESALALTPDYAATHYGLAHVRAAQDKPAEAFECATRAMRLSPAGDALGRAAFEQAVKAARECHRRLDAKAVRDAYRRQLEIAGGVPVRLKAEPELPVAAKLEIAEDHGRDYHLVRYKVDNKIDAAEVDHQIMHELVHLDLILQARAAGVNQLFHPSQDGHQRFIRLADPQRKKLEKAGCDDGSISTFIAYLYQDSNRLTYSTPVDLFVEDFLHAEFPDLRPAQFLTLLELQEICIKIMQGNWWELYAPPVVRHAARVLYLVQARQMHDLYGYDTSHAYRPSGGEKREAEKLWKEYLEYRLDRSPGEEYELVRNWGHDLKLTPYFELVDENEYRQPNA